MLMYKNQSNARILFENENWLACLSYALHIAPQILKLLIPHTECVGFKNYHFLC